MTTECLKTENREYSRLKWGKIQNKWTTNTNKALTNKIKPESIYNYYTPNSPINVYNYKVSNKNKIKNLKAAKR